MQSKKHKPLNILVHKFLKLTADYMLTTWSDPWKFRWLSDKTVASLNGVHDFNDEEDVHDDKDEDSDDEHKDESIIDNMVMTKMMINFDR